MTDILSITFPLFAVIGIGFVTVWRGWFAAQDLQILGRYVLNIALPALLFHAVASRDLPEVIQPGYMMVFLIGALATIVLSFAWFTITIADPKRRAIAVMGSTCPNSGFIGYPMMLLLFPDIAGIVLALNMLVENIVIIPVCLILMEAAKGQSGKGVWRTTSAVLLGVVRRPMVVGLLLGLLVSLLQLPYPAPVSRLFTMLAASASAVSLFVIGGSLVGLPHKGNWSTAIQISVAKLALHPAMTALALVVLTSAGMAALSPDLRVAVILSAAMPMFGIYTLLAQEYGLGGAASIAMLVATTSAFFTLSALLFWLL